MSNPERIHIINAFSFELGKCLEISVRQQVLEMLANVDLELATKVGENLGLVVQGSDLTKNSKSSPALSQLNTMIILT